MVKLLDSKQYKNDLLKGIDSIDLHQLNNKNVFITGGLGLIGSCIADLLILHGKSNVFIGARNEEEFNHRYGNIKKVKYVKYDALSDLNFSFHPDYIIHCAGLASPELYISNPVDTILSNFHGVTSLLEYIKKNNIKSKLVYVSSSEVYGNKEDDKPFKEGLYGLIDIDNIRSSYIIAKRASEMICKAYYSQFNVESVIVRPGHIYGPSSTEKDKRISSDFAFKSAKGLDLVMKSSGLQKRSYCYSVDCAVQILIVMLKGTVGEAYNVGQDDIISIREMAEIIAKAGNVELCINEATEAELKSFNPMNNSTLDIEKTKVLGYNNIFTIEEGLSNTVKILKEIINS